MANALTVRGTFLPSSLKTHRAGVLCRAIRQATRTIKACRPWIGKIRFGDPLFSFVLLLDLFLALHGHEEGYLIVACTVITDVPEAVGP
jgi:hypothetical protein